MDAFADAQLEAPARAAAAHGLCLHCLGRSFAKVSTGLRNDQRGELLVKAWGVDVVQPKECSLCEGLFARLDPLAELADAALCQHEFHTFLVGSRISHRIMQRESALRAEVDGDMGEAINSELNRELGRRLVERHQGPGSRTWVPTFSKPQITAIVDTRFDHVQLEHRSLYVYGRYRKLARGIPQTRWPCRACRGVGCDRCSMTGQQYETSVEALVADPVIAVAGATQARFHGAGREDVDARCLGGGRPFILELVDPSRRFLNLDVLRRTINQAARPLAEVGPLRFVRAGAVPRLKASKGSKGYEAAVHFDTPVPEERLIKALSLLSPAQVAQRTPARVQHRRADRVRRRTVSSVTIVSRDRDGREARLAIHGDAGLYIKELVSGDDGRTEPSLAALTGTTAVCTALDVVRVEAPDGFETPRQERSP